MTTVIDHGKRGHSSLGASGAERWMNCVGSVALLKKLAEAILAMGIPLEGDDPDYRREGTAMHEAGEHCLREGLDTWEIVGETFNETVIDEPMAHAIQVYLDCCRRDLKTAVLHYIEYPISSPVHPDFYGTADWVAIISKLAGYVSDVGPKLGLDPNDRLIIADLKGGEGIVVEPEDNPQLKYYAFGVIDGLERSANVTLRDDLKVTLRICQPRAYYEDNRVIREWDTTVGEIKAWVHDVLVPAMHATEFDHDLDAGPWCRFCPAKLVCPMMASLFGAACKSNPKEVITLTDESLGRSYQYRDAVRFYLKAMEDETFRRLNLGKKVPGTKLVPKKANRVFKSEAPAIFKEKFGSDAMHPAELKSPSEMEKLGSAAKELVREYAYTPQTGLTVATDDDKRPAVKIETSQQAFGTAVANIGE